MSVEPFTNFTKRKAVNNKLNTSDPQYGLCLKTYNSDLYQNWINTEWIEGDNVPSDTSTALASLIPFTPSIHSVSIQSRYLTVVSF